MQNNKVIVERRMNVSLVSVIFDTIRDLQPPQKTRVHNKITIILVHHSSE